MGWGRGRGRVQETQWKEHDRRLRRGRDHLTVSIRLYETLSHVNSELSHLGGFLSVLEDAERVVPDYEKIPTAAAQFGSVCGSLNATTPPHEERRERAGVRTRELPWAERRAIFHPVVTTHGSCAGCYC